MKAIQATRLGTPEVLAYLDVAEPTPGPKQVLIEVRGASVNYADVKARSGAYHLGKAPPYTPGIDVAGVVIGVGAMVSRVRVGDHVIAFPAAGSYADKTVADENLCFVIPPQLDFVMAAAAPIVAGTVLHMLCRVARLKKGERLLIHAAAGGVGTTALQIARELGCSQVYASVGSAWKTEQVRKFGAEVVVDYQADDYAGLINEASGGEGVDVILNPLGGATLAQDLKCLAPFGRLIVFGNLSSGSDLLPGQSLYPTNRTVTGFSFGHYRKFRPAAVQKTMQDVIAMLSEKRLDIPVARCFPLSEAAAAHRALEAREVVGKIVLLPDAAR